MIWHLKSLSHAVDTAFNSRLSMTGEDDLLRVHGPTRSLLAGAGRWCVYLLIACACAATPAIAAGSKLRGLAEIHEAQPGAARQASEVASTASARSDYDADAMAYVDHELDKIDAFLGAAHFRTALSLARSARDLLGSFPEGPQLGARRARLEVLAATAEVALGRQTGAQQSMIRALRADPVLVLDELETSPKVLELLRATRQRSGIEEQGP